MGGFCEGQRDSVVSHIQQTERLSLYVLFVHLLPHCEFEEQVIVEQTSEDRTIVDIRKTVENMHPSIGKS